MSESGDLLRMLEPAVRPVGPAGASAIRQSAAPFEGKSFETLLQEAQAGAEEPTSPTSPRPNLLQPLSQIDAVENASLRSLIDGAR